MPKNKSSNSPHKPNTYKIIQYVLIGLDEMVHLNVATHPLASYVNYNGNKKGFLVYI